MIPSAERTAGYLLLVAVFALHAVVLMQQPVVGTAENGDFWRVTKPAGIVSLEKYETVDHKYVSQFYGVSAAHLSSGFSSAAVIAAGAKWLGGGAERLDIRQVGAAYLLLFAAAFALALWAGVPPLLCGLLAWAGLDVSYSLYFNSFFADGAALLGFLAIALALLAWPADFRHTPHRYRYGALLVLAALIAGLSKNLYMLTPLLVAATLVAWPSRAWWARLRGESALLAALMLAGGLGTWHFTYGSGYRFPDINNHHTVFRGLATVADPAQVLAELGVDPQYVGFAGKAFFDLTKEEKAASTAALRDVSRTQIALGYLRDPRRIVRAVAPIMEPMRDITTADPNFDERSRPPAKYSGWWQFARLRGALFPLAVSMLLVGGAALLHAAWTRTWRAEHTALTFLLLNAVTLVVASILGDGFFGLRRHTMGTRFCLDLALALILYEAYRLLRRRTDAARD
ncbi:MAG: hypothetical protein ABI629_05855 [bacterium]